MAFVLKNKCIKVAMNIRIRWNIAKANWLVNKITFI